MDQLITQGFETLLKSAPLSGAIMLIFYLTRKEIYALFSASRGDGAMEKLMAQMVGQFEANLKYFAAVAVHTDTMQRCLTDILEVQHKIHTEIVRQERR